MTFPCSLSPIDHKLPGISEEEMSKYSHIQTLNDTQLYCMIGLEDSLSSVINGKVIVYVMRLNNEIIV